MARLAIGLGAEETKARGDIRGIGRLREGGRGSGQGGKSGADKWGGGPLALRGESKAPAEAGALSHKGRVAGSNIRYVGTRLTVIYSRWRWKVPLAALFVSFFVAPLCILLVAGLGALLHFLVIEPLLSAAPINQLLATGGVLFVLQSFATVAFGIDFRNLGIQLPVLAVGEMHFSYARLLSFIAALVGMVAVYIFMKRSYVGTAIRAIAQDRQIMPLMGVNTRRLYIVTSALGGALAGCEKGPAQKAGEKVDRAMDKLTGKGPAEKAGERLDKAADELKK